MSSVAEKTEVTNWNDAAKSALLQFLPNEHSQYVCSGFNLPHWMPIFNNPDGGEEGRLARLRESVDRLIACQFSDNGKLHEVPEEETRSEVVTSWRMIGFYGREFGAYVCYGKGIDLANVTETVHGILVKKQMDYGHGNISRFGRTGLIVRIQDKVARLENLMARGISEDDGPQNESLTDNVIDVMGYSAIGIMWESDSFLLPLAKN